jgi:hypothetical protein
MKKFDWIILGDEKGEDAKTPVTQKKTGFIPVPFLPQTEIAFRSAGTQHYLINHKQKLTMSTMADNFLSEVKLDMDVQQVDDKGYLAALQFGEVKLLEFENYLTEELMKTARRLNYIYDHLLLRLNRNGSVAEVENRPDIKQKWEQLKYDLQRADPFNTAQFIAMKDAELSSRSLLNGSIENLPLFSFLFLLLGLNVPENGHAVLNKTKLDQLCGAVPLPFLVQVTEKEIPQGEGRGFTVKGMLQESRVDMHSLKRIAKERYQIEALNKYHFEYGGEYVYNAKGWPQHAVLAITEYMNEQCYSSATYSLTAIAEENTGQ